MVIVWVNGTFGVGKTKTAGKVVAMSDQLRLFDPEEVGFLLRNNLPKQDLTDFQHLAPWRTLVPVIADEISRFTGQTLIAVQTVLNENYWNEMVAGFSALGHEVFHVLLDANSETLRSRIEGDAGGTDNRDWRNNHVDAFITARAWLLPSADLTIDTTTADPDAAARALFSHIKGTLISA